MLFWAADWVGRLREAVSLSKAKPRSRLPDWLSGLVTSTSTVAAKWAGATQVSWLLLTKVTAEAAAPPNVILAPVLKLLPASVTVVPPEAGPLTGLMEVMTGLSRTTT